MLDWLKKACSEGAPDFEPSASRVLAIVVVVNSLVLLNAIVFAVLRHHYAVTLGEVGAFMSALAAFDASVVGVLYGVNKVSTAISDIFSAKNK